MEQQRILQPQSDVSPGVTSATVEHLSIDQLQQLIQEVSDVRDIERQGELITFKFKDKDNDLMVVVAGELDEQRLITQTRLNTSPDRTWASAGAANRWNTQAPAHGTFSYAVLNGDQWQIVLESHLLLTGGVTAGNVHAWLENMLQHIDRWETAIAAGLEEFPDDSHLSNKAGLAAFLEQHGAELISEGLRAWASRAGATRS